MFPFVKLIHCNAEAFTEALQGREPEKSFRQDTDDEEETVAGIRDDQRTAWVWSQLSQTQPEDSDFQHNPFPMDKVYDAASVVSMNTAVSGRTTDGTGVVVLYRSHTE